MTDRSDAPNSQFSRLFEPLVIGNFTVRNRIVNTTHGTGLGEDRDLGYLTARARGGVGLMGLSGAGGVYSYTVGPGPQHKRPDWDQRALSPVTKEGVAYYDDIMIPSLRKRAEAVHGEGAKCFAQVFNLGSGGAAKTVYPLVAPSAVFDPYEARMPHPLTEEEVEELIFAYAQAIRRVAESGVDAAEIHGAHGYLVTEFFSPFFNRRTDRFGGSRENRVRFALSIIAEARKLVGAEFPIGIRVGVDGDGASRGMDPNELAEICALLSPHVAYINVSGGNAGGFGNGLEFAYVSNWYKAPGPNVQTAAGIKAKVDVPVFATGRIADPVIAEGILRDGFADMIGMVRALIADPELPNKAREGRTGDIRFCLGVDECHLQGQHRTPMSCAVNAGAAREEEMTIVEAAVKKTVVVVGAGPAGLEAARVAALRGHHVYLCDRSRSIGGTIAVLALDPNRRNLKDHAAFFETQLAKLGVEYVLGNEANADDLAEFGADAVVVATGGLPLIPQVDGIDGENVVTALEVLRGTAHVGDRVLVVGGIDEHIGGPTIAEFLADQGKHVEFVSEQYDFASGSEDATRLPLMKRLMQKDITVSLVTQLTSVANGGAFTRQTFTDTTRRHDEVTVVLACGLVPNDDLAHELKGRVGEVHLVGDALAPRRLMHATLDGARVAHSL